MRFKVILCLIGMVLAPAIARSEEPTATKPRSQWKLDWQKRTNSPFARAEAPAIDYKGILYLFGGFTEELKAANFVDVYDPATDSWARLKPMPTPVTHLNAAIDGTTVWFAGGFKGAHPGPVVDEVWKYDIKSDTWSSGPKLPEPRAGGGLAIAGRMLHYFGGYKSDRDTNSGEPMIDLALSPLPRQSTLKDAGPGRPVLLIVSRRIASRQLRNCLALNFHIGGVSMEKCPE